MNNVTPFRNIKHVSLLWASPDRAEELAALQAKLFDPSWSTADVRALLDHPASASLAAVTGDPKQLVGFVIGQLAADEAEIISIGVAPEWQRIGLGRTLVEGLIRAARRGEARKIHLEVAADNVGALALYKAVGFVESGRRPRYYVRADRSVCDAVTLTFDVT